MSKRVQEVAELVRGAFGGNPPPFKPCAYYDEESDRIVVRFRDCSYFENQLNDYLVYFEDCYLEEYCRIGETECAGFAVECARNFCAEHHILVGGKVNILKLLDELSLSFSEATALIGEKLRPLTELKRLENAMIPLAA